MGNLILVVEDNPDLLFNLQTALELNGYEVEVATNGLTAIEKLTALQRLPDLILSDIMMPRMNGYELFKTLSESPKWNFIPVIFLTARASPEDVRLGKILGVDDYLVKPVKQEDLLASIAGKIARTSSIRKNLEKALAVKVQEANITFTQEERKAVVLFSVIWSNKEGPVLDDLYAQDLKTPHMDQIGLQLYHSAVALYGQHQITTAQGLLLTIHNIDMTGYIYFDAIPHEAAQGKQQPFMLAVLAPRISYYTSLEIKEIFKKIAEKKKARQEIDVKSYWQEIVNLMSASPL